MNYQISNLKNTVGKTITVCLPVYNASKYLRECIDSILKQTFSDFELLIIDDGSADDCVEIIDSYDDSRIRLIKKEHCYIDTINMLIDEATGKYIARMDADDIMVKDRLQIQYDYMESHPEVDILGGGVHFFGALEADNILHYNSYITLERMLCGCCISHSTVMLVRDRINKSNIRYDKRYVYAEDFHFWLQALKVGLHIKNIPQILTLYRLSSDQVSSTHSEVQFENSIKACIPFINYHIKQVYNNLKSSQSITVEKVDDNLTIIIPFMNAGADVRKTVLGIRETLGDKVKITVVDDCSDDGYNYEYDFESLNIRYLRNTRQMGLNIAKEQAVQLSTTAFFMFIDIGMS